MPKSPDGTIENSTATAFPEQTARLETTRVWQVVCDCVERFVEAWEAGPACPPIADFVAGATGAARRLALVDLVKVDIEYRQQNGHELKRVEEYFAAFPELTQEGLPLDLIYEEFHIRKRQDRDVAPAEYFRRFPDHETELKRLLGDDARHLTSTILSGPRTIEIKVSDQIDDFDILAQLGKGAFATVYLARQRSMQRIVALKVSADKGLEAQTLAQLDHPHIVRVYDQRSLPDRGVRLLYMQYVPGGTLQAVVEAVRATRPEARTGKLLLKTIDEALDSRGESPPGDSTIRRRLERCSWGEAVCWIGARLASALDYAHGQGVLHRDIKPANVLVAADATPKLVDFNIACCSKVEGASPAAYFGGSLAYMSPEQLEAVNPAHERRPEELDGRSEVYSLGVLLWELVCGRRPFADDSPTTNWPQLLGYMTGQRRSGLSGEALSMLPRDLPFGLRETLLKCLEQEPSRRFASARDLARSLELCLRPSAQRLLLPSAASWRQIVQRYPTTTLAFVGVLPNAILSVLNYKYNVPALIESLPTEAQRLFYSVQVAAVNGLCYTLALTGGIWLCRPVLKAFHKGGAVASTPATRERCLRMGDFVGWVTIAAWALSGLIYPTWLWPYIGSGQDVSFFAHFFVSQLLCGLVSAPLAFFGVTFLAVRALYPALLNRDSQWDADVDWLAMLSQRTWLVFGVSVSVPFLALAMLFAVDSNQQWVFGAISLFGLFGFLASFAMARAIQVDLSAISLATNPVGESLPGETRRIDSLLTGSHRH